MECHNSIDDSPNTPNLNTDEHDRATVVPTSPAPEPTAEPSDSDSDDCIIQEVIPPPGKIDQGEAPSRGVPKTKAKLKMFPDGTVPQILLHLPYGTQDRVYTLTTINETQTMKRHRPRDNSSEPFSFTGTYTKSSDSNSNKEAIWLYVELFLGHRGGSLHGLW